MEDERKAVVVYDLGSKNAIFYYDDKDHSSEGTVYEVGDGSKRPWEHWGFHPKYVFDESFKDYNKLTNVNQFFYCVPEVSGLENINTSKIKDMSYMFYGCDFKSIDISSWDTSNVEKMTQMFDCCHKLESLNISGLNTQNLKDMSFMFNWDFKLKEIKGIENFDTSNVTNMSGVFCDCKRLKNLDLSQWDTSNVENLGDFCRGCKRLETLDLSSWDTSKMNNFVYAFDNCKNLTSIKGIENWNVEKVENFSHMFQGCKNLENFSVNKWSVNKDAMRLNMFKGCEQMQGSAKKTLEASVDKSVKRNLNRAYKSINKSLHPVR